MVENGQALVMAIRAWLRRYVAITPAQELVIALWVLHTYVYDRLSRTTPYVEITGASGTGKTTLMEAASLLARGSLLTNTIRTMFICRRVAETEGRLTLFVDEAEKLESASFGDQRSMLASGYRRGGVHGVTVGKGTETFPVWCPKMFTSTRSVTSVLHNRCIPIWMERSAERAKDLAPLSLEWERAEATAAGLTGDFKRLFPALTSPNLGGRARKLLAALSPVEQQKYREALTALGEDGAPADVDSDEGVQTWTPEHLVDERDREIWTPLFTLARTMGLDAATLDELTAASVDLSALRGVPRKCDDKATDEASRERSYAVRLLQDAKAVYVPGETFVRTEDLLTRLHALPTGPWRVYQQRGLTARQLGDLLGVFGLAPRAKRFQLDRPRVTKGRKREPREVTSTTYQGYFAADLQAVPL